MSNKEGLDIVKAVDRKETVKGNPRCLKCKSEEELDITYLLYPRFSECGGDKLTVDYRLYHRFSNPSTRTQSPIVKIDDI